jgi:hypothetical protein
VKYLNRLVSSNWPSSAAVGGKHKTLGSKVHHRNSIAEGALRSGTVAHVVDSIADLSGEAPAPPKVVLIRLALLFDRLAGDDFGVVAFPKPSRKFFVAELVIAIIGVVEVIPMPFLRPFHAI